MVGRLDDTAVRVDSMAASKNTPGSHVSAHTETSVVSQIIPRPWRLEGEKNASLRQRPGALLGRNG